MKIKLLFSISVCTLLISCKKDNVEPNETEPINNEVIIATDHLTGNFLLEITRESLYQQKSTWIKDQVIQMTVSGDTLRFNNSNSPFFIVTSDTQTVFTYSNESIFYSDTATLVYSNNFNTIQYDYYSSSLLSGPDTDKEYSGSRTTLSQTTYPHPYINEIEADYIMTVVKKDFSTGLDTSYIDTLTVTIGASFTCQLDNMSFAMNGGHSHHLLRYEDWSNNETVNIEKWYRTPDSLYIEQLDYVGLWSTPHDTLQWKYYGAKL